MPPLGSASKPDELCLSYPRNIASNILDVKVNEFTEVRDREKMHLNKRVNWWWTVPAIKLSWGEEI